jgi:hypothetical protein
MAHLRWPAALLLCLAWMAEAQAQLIISSNPYDGGVAAYGYGLGVRHRHRRHRLSISGFVSGSYVAGGFSYSPFWSPYGVTVQRVNVIVQPAPTVVLRQPPAQVVRVEDDISGVDLDEIDPITLKKRKPEERPAPVVQPRAEKKPPPAKRPAPPPPPPPQVPEDPNVNIPDPVERGKKAFAAREYGLAAQRFRQAIQVDPAAPLPHFLLAQAQFALGKYWDAVKTIRAGMDRKNDWPTTKFPPRALYQGNELDFLGHLKRLEDAVDKHPQDAALLFLLGYELWFDGKRAKARALFQKAKPLTPNPVYLDRFLKAP